MENNAGTKQGGRLRAWFCRVNANRQERARLDVGMERKVQSTSVSNGIRIKGTWDAERIYI